MYINQQQVEQGNYKSKGQETIPVFYASHTQEANWGDSLYF